MDARPYDDLAEVYGWFVPDGLLTPQGSAAAFTGTVELEPGARVLDCAAGTGQLAVGLALRGFDVVATDASGAMVDRARRLAAVHGATLDARVCAWEELRDSFPPGAFDAVFCVGNSITHAAGPRARRRALAAMAGVLRAGGPLALTSRNWELVRARGSRVEVGSRLVERDGRRGLTIHAWRLAAGWEERHELEAAVAFVGDDAGVTTRSERLSFWPFTHEELEADLRGAGLDRVSSTWEDEVERYLVVARA